MTKLVIWRDRAYQLILTHHCIASQWHLSHGLGHWFCGNLLVIDPHKHNSTGPCLLPLLYPSCLLPQGVTSVVGAHSVFLHEQPGKVGELKLWEQICNVFESWSIGSLSCFIWAILKYSSQTASLTLLNQAIKCAWLNIECLLSPHSWLAFLLPSFFLEPYSVIR